MAKWSEKVGLAIKPAANIHEATIHAQIRDRLASTKNGRDRMALLEKYGDDPRAVLTAPQFLSGLRDAELAMVKHKVEEHTPREIIEVRDGTTKAVKEATRGWELAKADRRTCRIRQGPNGSWHGPTDARPAA
jgi:hypothetical protein